MGLKIVGWCTYRIVDTTTRIWTAGANPLISGDFHRLCIGENIAAVCIRYLIGHLWSIFFGWNRKWLDYKTIKRKEDRIWPLKAYYATISRIVWQGHDGNYSMRFPRPNTPSLCVVRRQSTRTSERARPAYLRWKTSQWSKVLHNEWTGVKTFFHRRVDGYYTLTGGKNIWT